jgi:hypothetical protein
MKTLIDKTYNSRKIKEINANIHAYLNKNGLKVHFKDGGDWLYYEVVGIGELFKQENIKFNFMRHKSTKPDEAYTTIRNLFEGLMNQFGFDADLAKGTGWRLDQ